MTKILVAAALAALIATPASAQSPKSDSSDAAVRSYASTPSKAKAKKKNKTVTTQQQRVSPSGHPEWDVYVRGEYVGSDPDPRVRSTLRQEAARSYGFR